MNWKGQFRKADLTLLQKIWQSIWSLSGSVPLWLKIMGIVIFPLMLVVAVVILYVRHNIITFLLAEGHGDILQGIFPILTYQAALVLVITIVVGIGLAYQLSLILVRPMNQLITVIRKVQNGDLSARADVWTKDEIGQLQEAFNDMAMSLERSHHTLLSYNRALESVNDLAEAVTLGRGVDAVVETALNRVVTLMDVDVGSIYLLEKDGVTLKLKASQGFFSPNLAQAIAMIGKMKSPMQCLLEIGHAIAIENIHTSPEISIDLASMLSREGFTSWACAPLKMEGEVIGVYHLGKRGRRSFSSYDLALLEVVGNVVGSGLSNAHLLIDLRHKEAELRRTLHRTVELQEEERKRLARELHDEIGQALTSILLCLKTIQEEENVKAVNERLNELRFLTAQTIEELRRLAMDLRPSVLDSLGIVPALRWYIQQSADHTGLDIQFLGPEKYERLPPEIELTLYRVAQEGLTNAIRHSRAQKITVFFERDLNLNTVRLSITDNGTGFNAANLDRGLGLVGMRERVELLCGNFDIETTPGAGTQLWIEIPLKR